MASRSLGREEYHLWNCSTFGAPATACPCLRCHRHGNASLLLVLGPEVLSPGLVDRVHEPLGPFWDPLNYRDPQGGLSLAPLAHSLQLPAPLAARPAAQHASGERFGTCLGGCEKNITNSSTARSIWISVPVYISIDLSPLYLFVYRSIYLSIYVSLAASVYVRIFIFICLSI